MHIMYDMHNMHACSRGPALKACQAKVDDGNFHINLYLSVFVRTPTRKSAVVRARAKSVRANARAYLSVSVCARVSARICLRARICPHLSARARLYAGSRAPNDAGVAANASGAKNDAICNKR